MPISFWAYFKVGAPLTLITLAAGTAWLMSAIGDPFSLREKVARSADEGLRYGPTRTPLPGGKGTITPPHYA